MNDWNFFYITVYHTADVPSSGSLCPVLPSSANNHVQHTGGGPFEFRYTKLTVLTVLNLANPSKMHLCSQSLIAYQFICNATLEHSCSGALLTPSP